MSIDFLMNRQAQQSLTNSYKNSYERACGDRDIYKRALERIRDHRKRMGYTDHPWIDEIINDTLKEKP